MIILALKAGVSKAVRSIQDRAFARSVWKKHALGALLMGVRGKKGAKLALEAD